jgi:hypothetical protein
MHPPSSPKRRRVDSVEECADVQRTSHLDRSVVVTLRVGDPVPDLELIDHTGATWRVSEHRGRPVVLVLHRHLA